MRSGYVTTAVEYGAQLLKITEVTRHVGLNMLQVYSRRANLFVDHSGHLSCDVVYFRARSVVA
jgi:hypothetical protein